MLKNVSDITNEGKQTGLNTKNNLLSIDKSQSPNMMNVRVHFDGSLEKRLGSNTQNVVIIADSASAGFSPTGGITSNLIAFWKMDEQSGKRQDSIGGHALNDGNNTPSDGGIKNKAALFVSSNNNYLLHENTSTLATGDVDFSMSAWIYLINTNQTAFNTIISKKDLDTTDSFTKLLLHMSGGNASTTFLDSSSSNHTVTASNNAQITTGNSKFGKSALLLDGTGDTLVVNSSNEFNFGNNDFTLETFFNTSNNSIAQTLFSRRDDINFNRWSFFLNSNSKLRFFASDNSILLDFQHHLGASSGTYNHAALSRSGNSFLLFLNGILGTTTASTLAAMPTLTNNLLVGNESLVSTLGFKGVLDEARVSNGIARYTTDFTAPTQQFGIGNYEYFLFVDSNAKAVFRVSSDGISAESEVVANSFGALNTATWYNVIAWHDTGNFLGISVNLSVNTASYSSGVRSGSAPFVIGSVSNGASDSFGGRIDEVGFWKKVLNTSDRTALYNSGSANSYNTAFDSKPWASFDFGASATRWLTASAGTGVYASSNLGLTWTTIATDRTATYQSFERSKNVLIATSDAYDTPLAWPGSSGTFMTIVNSNAPLCKYSINFQGFLILMNSLQRKRGFFYQDENTQLTGTWASSFDIPSSADDEITASFILRRYLYVSTRYYIYRLSYVGGNPDFSYTKIKDWGYIQRTVKYIYVEGVGQIVAGLCWDGKMRFFDGSDDQIFSDSVEQDNSLCEFALSKINYSGSGPLVSFAETDYNENVYKLVLAIGQGSSETTHMLNYDGRSKSFYPYDRQHFNTMVMAESGNKRFLMAFDRSGYCHMMDSGNLDGNTTPINEFYDSNILFEKSPSQSHKGYQTHLFFENRTCGRIHYLDRSDFDNDFRERESFMISGSDRKFQIHQVIDCPENYNTYEWKITSSSGTSNPWALQRYDHFQKGQGIGKV